jgi:hypothetical protein
MIAVPCRKTAILIVDRRDSINATIARHRWVCYQVRSSRSRRLTVLCSSRRRSARRIIGCRIVTPVTANAHRVDLVSVFVSCRVLASEGVPLVTATNELREAEVAALRRAGRNRCVLPDLRVGTGSGSRRGRA